MGKGYPLDACPCKKKWERYETFNLQVQKILRMGVAIRKSGFRVA